jgi:hypothetical protein
VVKKEKMYPEELDRLYQQGYESLPEESGLGEAQIALTSEVLPEELL